MNEPSRPHLRLVSDANSGTQPTSDSDDLSELWIEPDDVDPLNERAATPAKQRAKRQPRSSTEFARVPFSWLAIPERSRGFPAWVRLYLWLWYRSYEGKRSVRLTGEKAAAVGLDRPSKLRRLRQLETRGLVTVARSGNKAPTVTVRPMARAATATTTVRDRGDNAIATGTTTLCDRDDNTP